MAPRGDDGVRAFGDRGGSGCGQAVSRSRVFGSVTGLGSIALLALRSLRLAAERCWAAGLKVSLDARFAKPKCDRRRLRSLVRSLAAGLLAGQRRDREAAGWLGAGQWLRVLANDVALADTMAQCR